MQPDRLACPDDNVLTELVSGRLDRDRLAQIERHLAACASCSEVIGHLLGSASTSRAADAGVDTDPEVFEPGERLGRYEITQLLGAGAMGIVYAARDLELDRRLALKVLRRDRDRADEELRARQLREARAMAKLSHPNVVAVYDAGVLEGRFYVAMELVEGDTLRTWMAERARPWRDVLDVFVRAGRGLIAAHAVGLVHRDFKPENVLVQPDGRVCVTDFGLARAVRSDESDAEPVANDVLRGSLESTMTRTGAILGTPAYMPPEQLRGAAVDARCDVFAFSVALHEALYGRRPYVGRTLAELLQAEENGGIPPAPRGTHVPERVRRALVTGLHADREQRCPSMQLLLDRLESSAKRRPWPWLVPGVVLLATCAAGMGILRARKETQATHPAVHLVERRLTTVGQDLTAAALSPSTAQLAYLDGNALHLLDVATGRQRPIALSPEIPPAALGAVAFFPDGQSLFLSSGGLLGDGVSIASLWQAPLDGSPLRKLREGGNYAALSPDGQRVAYVGEDGVYIGDREGTTSKRLFPLSASDICDSVAWSPGSDQIATITGESGILTHDRIDVVDVAQGTTRRLVGPAALSADAGSALVWTGPETIAYVGYGDPDGRPALWEIFTSSTAGASAARRLYTWARNDIVSHLSVARGKVAYARTHRTNGGHAGRLTPDGARLDGALERFSGTGEDRWNIVGSMRDGRFVLVKIENEQPTASLYAASPGGAPTPLGIRASFPFARDVVTPDDDVLTWRRGAKEEGTCRLLRVPLHAAADAAAEQDIGAIPCEAWVRCGRLPGAGCVVVDTVQGQTSFSRLDPRTGAIGPLIARRRLPSPEYTWDVSWDGSVIALPQKSTSGVILVDVARGASGEVQVTPSMQVQSVTFAPDGKHLFVTAVDVGGASYGVARVDLQGDAEILWQDTQTWLTRPVVSSDGRALGFRSRTYEGDAYWLEPAP